MLPIFSHGAHWLTAEEVMLRLKEDRRINLKRLEFAKEDMDSTVAKPIPWKGITKAEELVTGHVLVYPIRGRNFVMLTFAIVIDASEEESRAGAPGTWPPQWVAEMEAAVAPRGSRGRRKQ